MIAPIRLTFVVKVLLFSNLGIFILQHSVDQFFGGNLGALFALTPASFLFDLKLWQILTYSFLHADVWHLFFNLLMLVFIGGDIEAGWGRARFIRFYAFCVAFSGFCYLLMQFLVKGGVLTPMVGASGGIYGLLLAYGFLFGERTMLFMMLFPMKAKHFVWILAGITFMTTVFSSGGAQMSAIAHLGGMLAGLLYILMMAYYRLWLTRQKNKPRRKKSSSSHLRLVIDNDQEKDDDQKPKTWH